MDQGRILTQGSFSELSKSSDLRVRKRISMESHQDAMVSKDEQIEPFRGTAEKFLEGKSLKKEISEKLEMISKKDEEKEKEEERHEG